ncbi:MAG: AAA family ATPase [Legionellales bacterium]|nr:AAA family ATPase [Legionellales bacterium]
MMDTFSWQNRQREMIGNAISSNYIPNTILLSGDKGCGLDDFAIYIAKIMCCNNKQANFACNNCKSCNYFIEGNHSDLLYIGGKDELISISDIREMIDKIYYSPTYSSHRFVIIDGIEKLHTSSMNALLKTLEEPTKYVIFILVSYHRALIPETIKSRSKEIYFSPPTPIEVRKFLVEKGIPENSVDMYSYIAKYRPLHAVSLYKDDIIKKYEHLTEIVLDASINNKQILKQDYIKEYDIAEWLNYLELILSDVIRMKMHMLDSKQRNKKYFEDIQSMKQIDTERILNTLSRINELYFYNQILNIKSNKQLMIDDIMIRLLNK